VSVVVREVAPVLGVDPSWDSDLFTGLLRQSK
jgi:hypothetical protein